MYPMACFYVCPTLLGLNMPVSVLAVSSLVISLDLGASFLAKPSATIFYWTKTTSHTYNSNAVNFQSPIPFPWLLISSKGKRSQLLFWIWPDRLRWPLYLNFSYACVAICFHPRFLSLHFSLIPYLLYTSPTFYIPLRPSRPTTHERRSVRTEDDYWIACLVLLSRVPEFEDILLLRLPDRAALSRARPQYLRDAYQQFLTKEKITLTRLDAILQQKHFDTLRQSVTLPLLHSSPAEPPRLLNRRDRRT